MNYRATSRDPGIAGALAMREVFMETGNWRASIDIQFNPYRVIVRVHPLNSNGRTERHIIEYDFRRDGTYTKHITG